MTRSFRRVIGVLTVLLLGVSPNAGILSLGTQPAQASSGEIDRYYSFDGSDDVATGGFSLTSNSEFSIEMWLYFEGTATRDYGIFRYGGSEDSNKRRTFAYVTRDANGNNNLKVGINGTSSHTDTGYNLPDNEWVHFAIVREGQREWRVDINGAQVHRGENNFWDFQGTPPPFRLGGQASGGDHWEGRIDQVKIWDGVLSASEVRASMHTWDDTGITGESLLHHYDFNEASTSQVTDKQGSNHLAWAGNPAAGSFGDVKSESTSGTNTVVTFPRSYLTFSGGWTPPAGVSSANVLVVAGGGGGGAHVGGGGGGGGFRETTMDLTSSSSFTVVVGQGGRGAALLETGCSNDSSYLAGNGTCGKAPNIRSSNGQDSVFGAITSVGGGGGGSWNYFAALQGGSGGGASFGGADRSGAGTSGQGNKGGAYGSDYGTGGGGGAGSAGANASRNDSGDGGEGKAWTITGSKYAGGGGGGGHDGGDNTAGEGKDGGGDGRSAVTTLQVAQNGGSGTGGGGGGGGGTSGSTSFGGFGGSGVVAVAYPRTYILTLDNGGSTSTQSVMFGENPSDPGTTRSGFTLLGWSDDDDDSAEYDADLSDYTMDAANDTIYAVWSGDALTPSFGTPTPTADGFTVQISNYSGSYSWVGSATAGGSVSISGSGLVTVTGVTPNTSSTVTVSTSRTGFENGSATATATSLTSYTVTWDSNGGSSVSSSTYVESGDIAEPTPPTRSGKVFVGWSTSETSNQGNLGNRIETWPYDPPADSDLTLHSIWLDPCSPSSSSFVGTGTSDISSATYGTNGVTYNQLVFDNLTDCGWEVPVGVTGIDVLIVAGGGSAGYFQRAGGGGAGELLYSSSSLSVSAGNPYLVDIGAGGTFDTSTNIGNNGVDSRFGYFRADGGGAGGGGNDGSTQVGQNGGSGGGSPRCTTVGTGHSTVSDRYAELVELGNNGGAVIGSCTAVSPGGGGGGAGTAGSNSGSGLSRNGAGGNGVKIFGRALAAGGAAWNSASGLGGAVDGTIIGGSWSEGRGSEKDGVPGTGSGASSQGDGGSGVVVVRFVSPNKTLTLDNEGATVTQSLAPGGTPADPSGSTARAGYTLAGWSDASDNTAEYAADLSDYTMGSADDTLFAVWTADTYTVTFNRGSVTGASGSDETATKTHDVTLVLPNSATANEYFTKIGYSVTAWSLSADGSTSDFALGGNYTAEAPETLYPVWSANTYTVSYSYNSATGGNSTTSETYTVDSIAISLPTPTRTGYTFAGWHSESGLTTLVGLGGATYEPTADATLYAKWAAATFTVIFDYNGATSGNSDDDDTYTTGGTAITLPTPLRTGYIFGGWYSNVGLTTSVGAAGASYSPASNLTIYAKWTAITRSVTYSKQTSGVDLSTGGSVPIDSDTYIIDDTVVVKANSGSLSRTGFTFEGWSLNVDGSGTTYAAGDSVTVANSDVTFYPKWAEATYTLTYHANGGTGTLARASDTYTTGTTGITFPGAGTLAKTGYTFGGWSTSPTGSALADGYTTAQDRTLYAVWTIKSITYSYAKGVDGDNNSLSGFTFKATFPAGSSENFGTDITLSASVDAEIDADGNGGIDHQFFGWSDGTTVYQAGDTYRLTENSPITFTAQWLKVFSVRYALAGGSSAGSDAETDSQCLGTGNTCTDGQVISLNSTPTRAGYSFLGWEDQSGALRNASALTTISATSYLFTARWVAIDYTLTFNSLGGSNVFVDYTQNIGDRVTMPNPGSKTGYTFGGWSDGSTLYGIGSTFTVGSAGVTFTAQWIPNVYTVTYDWQGGASSAVKVSDSYTVGTGNMTLPTATGSGYSRDGYIFSGWSTTAGGATVSNFQPTAHDVLYAVWADGNYTLSYDAKGGTIGSGLGTVSRGSAVTLPTPVRENFTFIGWYDQASGGNLLGVGGASFTPTASRTLFARWVQDSLYGVDEATLETATTTITADGTVGNNQTASATSGSSRAVVVVPGGALPDGTVVSIRYFRDTDRQSALIAGDNTYFFSVLVSWLYGSGDSATVPDTHPSRPIEVTLENTAIKAGARVYQVIGTQVTDLGVATVDGEVTVELFEDPQLVVAATKPSAPTAITGSAGDTRVSLNWTAGSSGGSEITGYTVTASPGGATCSTASTSCTISSLTNNQAYTFSVTATNALGTSTSSPASSPLTPVGANYAVTFNANGGSAISDGSFFSGSTVSAPSNPSRSGFIFDGWSTVLDDASTEVTFPYAPGVTNAITLYALWRVAPPAPASDNSGGGGAPVPGTIRGNRPAVVPPGRAVIPQPSTPLPRPLSAPVVIVPNPGSNSTAVPQALVGGEPATVTRTTPSEGAVSLGVGRVQVGITPSTPPNSSAPVAPRQQSDVSVSQGQSARVSGGGLLPGSQLQLWLPGMTGGVPQELARIPVLQDGSFDSDLVFNARQSDTPVPIGRQTLQVTGYDELGNQTVLNMTITIGQGDPAPEPNKSINALPELRPGQSLVTSSGVPEVVTVEARPVTREVAVTAGDWEFMVSLPEDSGDVQDQPAGASITLIQSQSATVSGAGFQPDTRVDIWLFSDPTLLGSVMVSADGSFTGEVFLDTRFATVGEHTLQLQGVALDGFIKAANLGVSVQQPVEVASEVSASGTLWVLIALVGVAVMVVLVFALRRRVSRSPR